MKSVKSNITVDHAEITAPLWVFFISKSCSTAQQPN